MKELPHYDYGSGLKRYSTEILVALAASLCFFNVGMHTGWTAQAGAILTGDHGPIKITNDEFGVLIMTTSLGCIFGALVSYYMVQNWSQSKTILFSSVPSAIGFLTFGLVSNFYVYCFARFFVGINAAMAMAVSPVYGVEITSPEVRGRIGILMMISARIGVLLVNSIMPYFDFQLISICFAMVPITQCFICLFIPESPYLLLKLKDIEGARKALCQLRKTTNVEEELKHMAGYVDNQYSKVVKLSIFWTDKVYRKALLYGIILVLAHQLTGMFAILSYSQIVFEASADWIPAATSGIILSFFGILFPFVTSAIVDKYGRKLLIVVSSFIIVPSLVVLGFYFKLTDEGLPNMWGGVPLISMLVYTFGLALGLGSIIYLYCNELMPTNVRTLGSCFLTLISNGLGMLTVLIVNVVSDNFERSLPLFVFASCTLIITAIIVTFIPETKGRTFEEIQNELEFGKRKKTQRNHFC